MAKRKKSSRTGKSAGAAGKALVIVESPAKARTISRYLGPEFVVESSIGHVRDLPSTAAEVPPSIKGEPWARLAVDVHHDFQPVYVIPHGKRAQVSKLKKQVRGASKLYLATDEDREGEAIAWHLVQVLAPKCPVERMVFDEITRAAITRALNETRAIDDRLVEAQETRRILDRLVGYEVSPVLWRKIRPKLSAGRVQSVAIRLIVDREKARMRFVAADYWDITASLAAEAGPLDARLVRLGGRRVATGKDFEETTGQLKAPAEVVRLDEPTARTVAAALATAEFTVADVVAKPFTSRPAPPFITSTLQQEASRRLRFSAQRTMRVAQALYENGYITYMRTDSTTLSDEGLAGTRREIDKLFGKDFMPAEPRIYRSRSKTAQEAHEAIRPAGEVFRRPQDLAGELSDDERKLYEMIWRRTLASQMSDARGVRTNVRIEAPAGEHGAAEFATSGKVIEFPGFLRAWGEGPRNGNGETDEQDRVLPPLEVGQAVKPVAVEPAGHTTQPAARYTEASLIRELEQRGIGRPSTYAAILQTIQDRGYVWRKGTALVPTFTAFAVVHLLARHLPALVDYDFTAGMEDGLDLIANGQRESVPWLHDFYFGQPGGDGNGDKVSRVGLKTLVDSGGATIDARKVSCIEIGQTDSGEPVVVRVGRYGPYVQIGDDGQRANVPEDLPPDELTPAKARELVEQAAHADRVLGHDPDTGKAVYVKTGRFGPYVQLGEPDLDDKGKVKRGGKPKMASLWPGMTLADITLDEALKLLSFPRTLGAHPETGQPITAQDGRFGPYIKMGNESRSLPDHRALETVTLDQAVETLKQPKRRGRRAATASVLAELGKHPDSGATVQVKSGRYGPYVTDGVVNATVPKGRDPTALSLEDGLALIAAREQKLRDQGKDPRAPKPGRRRRQARRSG